MYYKDNKPSEIDGSNADKIDGLAKCYSRTRKSGKIYMVGRLNIDICEQEKFIVNDVDVRLKLVLGKPEFSLMNVDSPKYKYKN